MQWARFAAVSVFDLSENEDGCDVGGCDALTWMIKLSDVYGNEIMHVHHVTLLFTNIFKKSNFYSSLPNSK